MGEIIDGEPGKGRPEPEAAVQRGTNQAGMRAHNERLVLSLVRRHGALSKTEIARMVGLSAQTVSVIMRGLEADRLLKRGAPQRGRVGQPSVPLALNPDGAFFIGAKIGRRSLDVVLVDFTGEIRHHESEPYAFPEPGPIIARIRAGVAACADVLGEDAGRIAGLGVAMPFELWSWADEIGAPPAAMQSWRHVDVRAELATALPWPVYLQNDATAACGAELAFGGNAGLQDLIYFYIGAFIGGGLVLNGGLFTGRTGNAAAIGSMPVPDGSGGTVQLIDRASLVLLERRLRADGMDPGRLYLSTTDWADFAAHLDEWIPTAACGIAHAIAAAATVVDFEAAVIDGAFPEKVKDRLVARVRAELRQLDLSGIDAPDLRPGTVGPVARALGGASLPLFDRYLVQQIALAGSMRRAG